MDKKSMREKYKIIRKTIQKKSFKDYLIFLNVIKDIDILDKETILIYVSMTDEIDTLKIIKHFLKEKRVAVPKIENNSINFYYINDLSDLSVGYSLIMEPTTNDKVIDFSNCVCITPGICFDYNNYRIGYGKGFYDRFFKDNDVYSVGLCYKECLVRKIDINRYDIPVKKIITD